MKVTIPICVPALLARRFPREHIPPAQAWDMRGHSCRLQSGEKSNLMGKGNHWVDGFLVGRMGADYTIGGVTNTESE